MPRVLTANSIGLVLGLAVVAALFFTALRPTGQRKQDWVAPLVTTPVGEGSSEPDGLQQNSGPITNNQTNQQRPVAGGFARKWVPGANLSLLFSHYTDIPIEPPSFAIWPKSRRFVKKHGMNWSFLADYVPVMHAPRRFYLDLGARGFGSSIGRFFLTRYPNASAFEIHAFEVVGAYNATYATHPEIKFHNAAVWVRDGRLEMANADMAYVAESARGKKPGKFSVPAIDFAAYLQANFLLSDFVVVKMDVEGAEHEIIPHLLRTGAAELIDEIFFECHYREWHINVPTVRGAHTNLHACLRMLEDLRRIGVWAHQWA